MKNYITLLFLVALLIVGGCKKDTTSNNPTTIPGGPTVTTAEATNVGFTGATLGGNITSEGSCTLLTSGVVLGTTHAPTTSNTTIPNITTTGTGSFTVAATGLLPATTYYARAYAANCKGINYGNEIHFTTLGGGGGGTDTGYFNLSFDGGTFVADDMFGPNASHVYPEGDTRFAYLSIDSASGEFNIIAQSSYMVDDAKPSGFSFAVIYKPLNSTGTYTFTDGAIDNTKSMTIQRRYGTGPLDASQPNYSQFVNTNNESRHLSGSSCVTTNLACSVNTIHITTWGEAGSFVEGSITGTVYETAKEAANCVTSTPHAYVANFKLKRFQ